MSAGTGITHSEFNPSDTAAERTLYQIWLFPQRKGIQPSYEQKSIRRRRDRDQPACGLLPRPTPNSRTRCEFTRTPASCSENLDGGYSGALTYDVAAQPSRVASGAAWKAVTGQRC